MANQNSYKQFKNLAAILVLPSFGLFMLATVLSLLFSNSIEAVCVFLLFGLPMLVQVGGLRSLDAKWERAHKLLESEPDISAKSVSPGSGSSTPESQLGKAERQDAEALVAYSKFYLYTMALCLFVYNALWVVYELGQLKYHWEDGGYGFQSLSNTWYWTFVLLSPSALVVIGALLFMVTWMTRAVISGEVTSKEGPVRPMDLYYLRLGAAQAPFLTLVFFLTVFLGVSYLFGLAFAFHDKTTNSKDPALVLRNLIVPDPALTLEPGPQASASPIAVFMFETGVAVPTNYANQLDTAADAIRKKALNDNPARITLIGGADLRQINSPAYQSNYELAEARALYVKKLIMEKLSSTGDINTLENLDWVCLPRPNEGKRERKPKPVSDQEADDDRKVHVFAHQQSENPTSLLVRHLRANHVKPLSLMDYVYFANYTVTTTGYGDIIPNTAYTKFICSFANIVEVFFLVVFFNTLLSLVGRRSLDSVADGLVRVETRMEPVAVQIGELHERHGRKEGRGS